MDRHLVDLSENRGVPVSVVAEDLPERGSADRELVSGAATISRRRLPALFADYDVVSHGSGGAGGIDQAPDCG
jgi:hypothetical protein